MTTNQPRTKYRPDQVMIAQARGLKRACEDLSVVFDAGIRNTLSEVIPGKEIPKRYTDEVAERYAAIFFILPILQAFATELTLKAIASMDCGQHPHDHDLRKLYDNLNGETRLLAETSATSRQLPPIRDTLEEHKDDFVNWRYAAEAKTLNTKRDDLYMALTLLLDLYDVMENAAPSN